MLFIMDDCIMNLRYIKYIYTYKLLPKKADI